MFNFLHSSQALFGEDLGERALNTVVSQSIRQLFTRSESVEAFVRCSPTSIWQGSIDGLTMSGRNLTIRKDFQIEEMLFETDVVSIDFRSALNGQISLKQPTQAIAQVILSEAGINYAFKSLLVAKRLQNISIPGLGDLPGGTVSFTGVKVELLPHNQIRLFAKANLPNYGTVPVFLRATLVVEKRRRLSFQHPHFELDLVPESIQAVSHDLTVSLVQLLDTMVDLDRFNLDGVKLRLNDLKTEGKKLIFSGYAQIEHFPGTSSGNPRTNACSHEGTSADNSVLLEPTPLMYRKA
ncbi:MAG: DUF2993 domain-containing protein [Cyanophyceae cyanobacterium]